MFISNETLYYLVGLLRHKRDLRSYLLGSTAEIFLQAVQSEEVSKIF